MSAAQPAVRTAVVTGGSRGIGRAVVERLARDGVRVVLTYAHDDRAAEDVVTGVRSGGGSCWALQVDLTEDGAVPDLFDRAEWVLGGVDILVNNAATGSPAPSIAETTEEHYDRLMAINTRAVFLSLREAATRLRSGGRIVTISSTNTAFPVPGVAAYAGSKAAVEQFSAVAAREFGQRGITVNCVSPGPTDTDMLASMSTESDRTTTLPEMTPLGRLGRPDDIADVVAFLVGPDGRWVNGHNVRASGGLV